MRNRILMAVLLAVLLGGCTIVEPIASIDTPIPLPSVEPLPTADLSNGSTEEQNEPTATLDPISANAQVTTVPEVPTVTLEPLYANTFPQGSEFRDSDQSMSFQTVFPDTVAVESVTFQIFDGDTLLYEQTDQSAPYCAFDEQDGNCTTWRFADNNNQWPGGTPAQDGATYRLVATSLAADGRTQIDTLTFVLLLS